MTDVNEINPINRGFNVVHLPISYSGFDQEYRRQLLKALARLEDSYRQQAEPILKQLADIDARYAPRVVLVPK